MISKFMMIVNGHLICGCAVTSLQHCSLLLNHRCCHSEKNLSIRADTGGEKSDQCLVFWGSVLYGNRHISQCIYVLLVCICGVFPPLNAFPQPFLLTSLLPQAAGSLPDTGCIGCKASGLMSCFPLALRMGAVVSLVKQTSFKGACFAV